MNQDVHLPKQLRTMHLFAGAGGGILGDLLLGHRPVCAVEIEPYCRKVLLQRQRDGILPRFPIWDDVRTFRGTIWRGSVDVLCGGFPCQDISSAGRGAGINGERSGLWKEYARIIEEVQPQFVFAENSPLLRKRGLNVVLHDLADLGYDARWCVLGSGDDGATHHRRRIWVLAYPKCDRQQRQGGFQNAMRLAPRKDREAGWFKHVLQGRTVPYVCRTHDVVAGGVDRLTAIGNGQDPRVAALAWQILTQGEITWEQ